LIWLVDGISVIYLWVSVVIIIIIVVVVIGVIPVNDVIPGTAATPCLNLV
jgi:hypothetical protein